MIESIKAIFVEDVRTDAELEIRELRRAGIKVEHRLVDTDVQFLAAVDQFAPDIILSDFSMPHFDGMAALALARQHCPLVPFIFVSGTLGEEYAIRALQQGAADYVLKTNLIRLPAAVTRAVREAREREARRIAEAELEAARERLKSIFESLDDAVWSWSIATKQVTYIAPAARTIYGRQPEEFTRSPDVWHQALHDADREAVLENWRELLDGKRPFDMEYRIVRPDGEIRWISHRGRLILAASGAPERVDGIVRDITERMEQQKRIARLTRIRELSSAVNSAIVRLRQRQPLFEEVCRIATQVGGFLEARVITIDSATQAAQLVASMGGDVERFRDLLDAHYKAPDRLRSILGQSLQSGEPAFVNGPDAGRETHDAPGSAAENVFITASLPFLVKEEVVGALLLRSPGSEYPDPDEIRLLKELAGNISFALELIGKQDLIDYLAYYDALTGLPNRTLFQDRLTQALGAAKRDKSMLALAIFNVVRLKVINDSLGERAGDAVLRQVAECLKQMAGDPARIARLGGDLFAVMIPGVRDPAHVSQVLGERRIRFFDEAFKFEDRELRISVRAGIALYPNDGDHTDSLFHNAESALKQARHVGEQFLFYAPDVNVRVAERLDFESRLRRAVEQQEFELHFQPKVDLDTRHTVGLEALIRWRDPEKGLIPPMQFVHTLEETGLILDVGRWVIQEAVGLHRRWREDGLPSPRIAVNISALQLRNKDFVADVQEALRGAGSEVGLDLEITESMLMENVTEGVDKLRTIREMGVQIAIDDFGTGYSSLAYISRLPVNALKIDRSFIQGMTDDPDKTSIVSTIISLGHALRLEVIAEGVETDQQAQLLRLLRCDQIQGYLISHPLGVEDIRVRLQSEVRRI